MATPEFKSVQPETPCRFKVDVKPLIPEMLLREGLAVNLEHYRHVGNAYRLLNFVDAARDCEDAFHNYGFLISVPQVIPLTDKLFRHYTVNGKKFSPEIEADLTNLINSSLSRSETGRLTVRRAFHDPAAPKPDEIDGPRFNGLPEDPLKVIEAIKEMYDYAISQGWDKRPEVEVALNLQEFVNPKGVEIHDGKLVGETIPYGGAAWYDPSRYSVFIQIACGDNRAVTVYPELTDQYRVRANGVGLIIEERDIKHYKPLMYLDRGNQLVPIELPREKQVNFTPIDDVNLMRMATVAYQAYQNHQEPIKIEFSLGRRGLYVNEESKQSIVETKVEPLNFISRVYAVITKEEDVRELRNRQPRREDYPPIVYISPDLVGNNARLRNILVRLNQLQVKKMEMGIPEFQILLPSGETAHAFKNAKTELNLNVIGVAPEKKIGLANRLKLTRNELGVWTVYNLTIAGTEKARYLQQYPLESKSSEIGNKAYSTQMLHRMGFPVPPAFVLVEDFFMDYLIANGADKIWFSLSSAVDSVELKQKFAKLQNLAKMPNDWEKFEKVLVSNFGERLGQTKFAVRSSGIVEDLETKAFAGQFYTGLDVAYDNLAHEVRKVMRSPFTDDIADAIWSEDPTVGREILNHLSMPVLIMPQVDGRWSGTVFHRDMTNDNPHVITIEAEPGVGGVVGGESRGARLTVKFDAFTKKPISIVVTRGAQQVPLNSLEELAQEGIDLPSEEIIALRESAAAIKAKTGKPHDTEWVFGSLGGEPNKMWYTQTRPVKTS